MKRNLFFYLLLLVAITSNAQNPFFEVVNYRGAFAPAPATPWTDGWTNWDPQNTVYGAPTVTVSSAITTNTTWTSGNVYLIQGLIYVKNGATLTIQPGTVIRGDASVPNSSLVITKGSKINAVGTAGAPIVFTSSNPEGSRNKGDWGGVIILGKSTVNLVGGVGNIEGIATSADTQYGGGATPDDNDNSGNLKYVRIEFGGYVFDTDKEINGLTMGGVGRNTVIDFVQCSFINDDSFEWFGGTVNASHLVAYRGLDDDFDTDNGFSGSVQYCLSVKDPDISDQSAGSTSEGFESDNDATGSANTPQTTCVFSNVTIVGPFRGTTLTSWPSTFKFRRAARLRRNSGVKILNSVLMDFPYGVFIDGTAVRANLQTGVTVFKNNLVAGCFLSTEPGTLTSVRDSLFSSATGRFKNDSLTSTSSILVNPYDFLNPDYRPASGSPALTNVNFSDAAFNNRIIVVSASSSIREVTYRGAFAPSPAVMWTEGWTNWDPQNTIYPTATVNVTGNITTNTTWTTGTTYRIQGLVYVQSGVTLTIQPGVIIRGDHTVPNSSLVITKNAKLVAVGTADQPIVFTSDKAEGTRSLGDWGGIIILGRASYNGVGGVGNIEGIAASSSTEFGGGASPNDNDNSGSLKYVRIEFGGYIFDTDKEINGLTMGAVGRATSISYIQCSFINDDAFEWFGGTVNCDHLVAYRCVDDNWDTDNGFSGSVQFCLGVKDPALSDQSAGSTSEGFESDNDATGSSNLPQTKALFTNVTEIGAFRGTVLSSWPSTFKFRRGARMRRNTGVKIFNSIIMDSPYGVFIDGTPVRANLQSGVAKFKNNLVAGCFLATEPGTLASVRDSLFNTGTGFFKNDSLATTVNVLISPYNFTSPDYRPGSNPLVTTGAAFTDPAFNGLIVPCDEVSTPAAISGDLNINGCLTGRVYSIPAIANASSYFWTVPAGATIVSGQGTRTITVNFLSTVTSGNISVVGKNDCGNTSVPSTKAIVNRLMGNISSISAPTGFTSSVCTVVGRDTALTYTVPALLGATNYIWTAPSNTQIMSGQGTNTIALKFLAGYTTALAGDTLRVEAFASTCQASKFQKLAIKAAVPAAPSITITPIQTNVCGARIYRYIGPVLAAPATGYEWQFQGTLWSTATIDSGSLTSRILVVRYTSNAAAVTGVDSVKLRLTSNCGAGAWKGLKLSNLALNAPSAPARITATALPTLVCGQPRFRYTTYDLTVGNSTTVPATGWQWSFVGTLGAAAVIDSGSLSSQTLVVHFTSTAAGVAGDSIRVRYTSSTCGNSPFRSLFLKIAASSTNPPVAPSKITIYKINDFDCAQPRYRYVAPALTKATASNAAATGWNWSFTGLGTTAVIDSGNINSQAICVRYPSLSVAQPGDSVRVRFTSLCGNGPTKGAKLSNLATYLPAPASCLIELVSNTCGNRIYRYTAPVLPAATASYIKADGYLWSLPTGPLGSTGILDSGVVTGRSIRIKYSSNAASTAGDSIRIQYTTFTDCDPGPLKAFRLSITALTCPREAGNEGPIFTKNGVPAVELNEAIYPNPNNGQFTLSVNNTGIQEKAVAYIQVLDMFGKVVHQENAVNENNAIVARVNINTLSSGVYHVRYIIGSISRTVKMVVIK